MSLQHYSPLRYPGGKSSLFDFLKNTIIKNGIVDGTYAEGFAGGAGAALKLLMLEEVNEIYLNDKDELIFKFWDSVLNNTEEILKLIRDTPANLHEWTKRKEILKSENKQHISDVELGFTAFFLNRCNRSGILKAGMIGGNDQSGNWKIDARYNKADLLSRIEKIAIYKDRIHIFNNDIITFLGYLKSKNFKENELLIYLDPPYVNQGKELYRYYFKEEDHKNLAEYLQKNIKYKWLVSYDDDKLIHTIYDRVSKNIFEFNYFANQTKVGEELIITSDNCLAAESYLHYSKKKKLEGYSILRQAI